MSAVIKPHLWQGSWISDSELREKIKTLPLAIENALKLPLEIQFVLDSCDRLSQELCSRRGKIYRSLADCLQEEQSDEISEALQDLADFMKRESLEQKLFRELGTTNPFVLSRPEYRTPVFESWAPLGFLVHIAPTNSESTGALSVIEGLLTLNVNFLKTSGSTTLFAQLFLKSLIDLDPTQTISPRVFAARISSTEQNLLKEIISSADGIAAWGTEGAIKGVQELAPPFARLIDWGPKISFALFASDSLRDEEAIAGLARECSLLEQQACSSPQCVYVETNDRKEILEFANRLAFALEKASVSIPGKEPALHEQAEITSAVELCRLESCLDLTKVIESPSRRWRILVEHAGTLRASPLFRTIWVKPIQREQIIQTFRPFRSYLQTAGLACKLESLAGISETLFQSGVLRITRVGHMLESYSGEPHDGAYALQRYARRISAQLGPEISKISSFSELKPSSCLPPEVPLLNKEAFQSAAVNPERSHLFFKSGGSSGEPKLSIFSYDDYHLQMSAGADGLFAAGLDPAHDRCMNLFFGGGLYGGFISFFTVLENLKAVQFPMGAHPDTRMVAETIVRHKANVLLGMPSYIIQLFGQNADFFQKNKVVEKIFYAGEHFNEIQKGYFQTKFGVKVIRSAAYGSVDAGPIGFQCEFGSGSIHHLHTRLHILEILDLEKDLPAPAGEPGRIVLTSLARAGQRLERYEIGDVGKFLPGICPCGRHAPRFELLGRRGDVFRIGSAFFNYEKFAQILADEFKYAGELQIVLCQGAETAAEELRVLVSLESKLDSARVKAAFIESYKDLQECISDKVLNLNVLPAAAEQFKRTAGSGKLQRVIDERSLLRRS